MTENKKHARRVFRKWIKSMLTTYLHNSTKLENSKTIFLFSFIVNIVLSKKRSMDKSRAIRTSAL